MFHFSMARGANGPHHERTVDQRLVIEDRSAGLLQRLVFHFQVDGRDMSVAFIQSTPLGHFTHISITTPVVSALKNY